MPICPYGGRIGGRIEFSSGKRGLIKGSIPGSAGGDAAAVLDDHAGQPLLHQPGPRDVVHVGEPRDVPAGDCRPRRRRR
eukprot:1414035-Pyramimonas_sp.AAC.1